MLVPGANTGILVSRRNRSSETEHECRVHRAREREAVGKPASRKVCRRRKLTSGTQIFHSVSAAAIRDDAQVGRRRCARRSRPVRRCGRARLDHAADDTPAAPQRRQGRRYGTCSAGQRPVPDVIRRAIERDGRLRPPRTAPRSGPPRPRRPPAAPRDASLEGIDRHRDPPGQPRRPSGAHRPWGLHACHPARRRFGRTPPWSSATPRASARAKEPSVGTYLRSSGR